MQALQKQLEDVKDEEMSLLSKHKEVESELAAARERLQQQATDLVLKASMYDFYVLICNLHEVFFFQSDCYIRFLFLKS